MGFYSRLLESQYQSSCLEKFRRRIKSKIEERSNDMTNLINIYKEKSSRLNDAISVASAKKQSLKENLDEKTVKSQAIDNAQVADLNNQMQLSKKRIAVLTNNCEAVKDEQSKLDTDLRKMNFQLKSEIAACDIDLPSLKNLDFAFENWQKEDAAVDFKNVVMNVKTLLNDNMNKIFSQKSQLEKENCEKNVDLINMNDQKQELIQKVAEVDKQYKISEMGAKGMLSDAIINNDDSILRLSNDKWSIKKEISNQEAEIILLESK
ncbi:hypothetical protein RF11_14828 [Thelohanellus kitauei]|uniref:Uncharacterized protein n=1 Tax=Thelohanellus kitauei TaxID=669202 RepID=A0A0C2IYD3_THEKT|nr:hypothetical protein RF11_14828 [Thelohanellus kitauei]